MNTGIPVSVSKVEEKFSPWKLLIVISLTFGLYMMITRTVLEKLSLDNLWELQIHPIWWKALIIFAGWQLIDCFIEWFFHRYMLHAPIIGIFSRLFVQHHWIHHKLTNITQVNHPELEGVKEFKNNYPIDDEKKYRASYFPFYTYTGFVVFSLGIIVLNQWLLPTWPVLVFAVVSIGWSLVMYEILHWIHHLPKVWDWLCARKSIGTFCHRIYVFHELHHEWSTRYGANQNISGFLCGLPLADWLFGTLKIPKTQLFTGSIVIPEDIQVPIPRFKWIRQLDAYAARKVAAFRPVL
jgi:hemolysin III